LAVAATHGAVVDAMLARDDDVEGVESHKLIPHDVVLGSADVAPAPAETGWVFCPQPTMTNAPSAITATARAKQDPDPMKSRYHHQPRE
jgi:hypothetical protein